MERECRPSSIGEEELQLQIALAISKEEAQQEKEVKDGDDIRSNISHLFMLRVRPVIMAESY